jgi:hypothetical protein
MPNRSSEKANDAPPREHPQSVRHPDQHRHGQMNALYGKILIQKVDGDRIVVLVSENADYCRKNQENQKPNVSHERLSNGNFLRNSP